MNITERFAGEAERRRGEKILFGTWEKELKDKLTKGKDKTNFKGLLIA